MTYHPPEEKLDDAGDDDDLTEDDVAVAVDDGCIVEDIRSS